MVLVSSSAGPQGAGGVFWILPRLSALIPPTGFTLTPTLSGMDVEMTPQYHLPGNKSRDGAALSTLSVSVSGMLR